MHRLFTPFIAIALLLIALARPAAAHVTRFELVSRTPIAYGYEKITGRLWFGDDPAAATNRRIVDLALAPRTRGLVVSSADVLILAPADRSQSNGAAVIDIPNRGGATALALNRGRFSRDPARPDELGDGFLMRHGFSVVAIGWQFDVPHEPGLLGVRAPIATNGGKTITGLVRSDFHVDAAAAEQGIGDRDHVPYPVAAENDAANVLTERDDVLAPRRVVPRERWRFTHGGASIALDGKFVPGKIYELVYRAKDPVVVGLGLAAVRDAVSYLKHDAAAPLHVARAYGFGISQSGRFLRTLVQRGFDADETGRPVFDAIVPIVSGPSLGSFDHRFAQPSRDAAAFSSFFYPTDVPPFREADWPLPRGLKVIDVDTSHEYWGRTASLMTTTDDGTRDAVLPDAVRFYAIAGGMHIPSLATTLRDGMRQRTDPLDYRWVERALLLRLDDWVRTGAPPPPSRYPTIADGTLVAPDAWTSRRSPASSRRPRSRCTARGVTTSDRIGTPASTSASRPRSARRTRRSYRGWTPTAPTWAACGCRRSPRRSRRTPAGMCAPRRPASATGSSTSSGRSRRSRRRARSGSPPTIRGRRSRSATRTAPPTSPRTTPRRRPS